MMTNTLPLHIDGLSVLRNEYDALLCDVWGVIHNGVSLFPHVTECLENWQKSGGKVLLFTNAPRPAEIVKQYLDNLCLPKSTYDKILSSGDATQEILIERLNAGQKCYFIGPSKDMDLFNNIDINFVEPHEADFVLITGLLDDSIQTPEDYKDIIKTLRIKNLPMICANPDKTVQIDDRIIYCAGAVAKLYEEEGGEVTWVGKPHTPIYTMGKAQLQTLTGKENPRILAIGDGYETDILGANQAQLDVMFVTGGLAKMLPNMETGHEIKSFLKNYHAHTNYFCKTLKW